jgi:hypothetical protein
VTADIKVKTVVRREVRREVVRTYLSTYILTVTETESVTTSSGQSPEFQSFFRKLLSTNRQVW